MNRTIYSNTSNKHLLSMVRKFFENNPVGAAQSLETMEESEAISILKSLPISLASQAFKHLQSNQASALLKALPPELFKKIIVKLEPNQIAPIFLSIPENVRTRLLTHLTERNREQIREFLSFPEDSAGRIMSTKFIAFHPEIKVKDAINKIRILAKKKSPSSYIYIVDITNHLIGIINMRDLMLASHNTELGSIMRKDIFSVDSFMDQEEVANILAKRGYFAAPVVDSQNRLLGIVKTEELIVPLQAEASEDIQKMFGAGGNEKASSPIAFSLRKRLPWLHINLVTAFLAAFVVFTFEDIIAKITILAVFLPVVAGEGGNAGAQSLAVIMRGLVMREIPRDKVFKIILKESWIGFINGVIIGAVTALVTWLWHGNPFLGVVIGLAMIINLFIAGLSGAAIPIIMKSMGFDPAQSSNIILTTITDVVGFFTFLGLAVLFQGYLL